VKLFMTKLNSTLIFALAASQLAVATVYVIARVPAPWQDAAIAHAAVATLLVVVGVLSGGER